MSLAVHITIVAERYFERSSDDNPVVIVCTFIVVSLSLLYQMTLPACRFTFKALQHLLRISSQLVPGTDIPCFESIINDVPADLSTALKRFDLEPESVTYACCPECFALYPPRPKGMQHPTHTTVETPVSSDTPDPLPFFQYTNVVDEYGENRSNDSPFPMRCVYQETTTDGRCGARLLRANKNLRERENDHGFRPIRTYTYQSLISWVGRMLSRPEIERMLEQSIAHECPQLPTAHVDDVLHSPEVAAFEFRGRPFLRREGSEMRLLFSLFIDWFNPHGNRQAGASISSGVIFMACLNLPPEVRFKRENIYLAGVLPGPKAPSIQEVNHFVAPIIPELLELWNAGAQYSRTALHPKGRLVRAALIALVADLGAVRKTSGQASHSATYFCSFCQLKKCDINQTDPSKWPRRDCDTFRRLARAWQHARTRQDRTRLFKAHGVRYSILLELPYWKPTRFVVLDTMHNLFLGLFQRHCRRVFGMDIKIDDHTSTEEPEISHDDLIRAIQSLQSCAHPKALSRKLNLSTLRALYEAAQLGLSGKRTKLQMAEELMAQVAGVTLDTVKVKLTIGCNSVTRL